MNSFKIAFVSAEVAPFAKTGGLADVASALPKALNKADVETIVILPKYGIVKDKLTYVTDFPVMVGDVKRTCVVRKKRKNGTIFYFVDNYHYFGRDNIYGYMDDGERFAFFAKASILMLKEIGYKASVVHLNDWHTGPIAALLKDQLYDDVFYKDIKTIYTIHNLRYQGLFDRNMVKTLGLNDFVFTKEGVEFYEQFSFMKAGIVYSDIVTTVSKTYASEILTEAYGEQLNGLLVEKKDKLFGIVNGIDTKEFNPAKKSDLEFPFNLNNIDKKVKNKIKLQKDLGLTQKEDVPMFAIVSRLANQKGLHLVLEAVNLLLDDGEDFQFVLLGTGDPGYEEAFSILAENNPNRISANILFDALFAKKIYASADMFLMPSLFEPCGLGQLISYRYGTVPVVRETGGLKDTVIDINSDKENGTGFTFKNFSALDLKDAMLRAIRMYGETESWAKLVERDISLDYGWENSAKTYIDLYIELMNNEGTLA